MMNAGACNLYIYPTLQTANHFVASKKKIMMVMVVMMLMMVMTMMITTVMKQHIKEGREDCLDLPRTSC